MVVVPLTNRVKICILRHCMKIFDGFRFSGGTELKTIQNSSDNEGFFNTSE